jgi:hypothetical protein
MAFFQCSLLSIDLSATTVTSILQWAFLDCRSLRYITLPDSLTTIGQGAFQNCTSLTSVTLPDSLTTIQDDAFYGTDDSLVITWCAYTYSGFDKVNRLQGDMLRYGCSPRMKTYNSAKSKCICM